MIASTTRYLDLPGGRLAYDDTGTGMLIVMTPAMLDLRAELRFIARWIVERLGSELLLLDGAGHHPHVEYPDEIAAAVTQFARRISAPEAPASRKR